MYNNLEYSLRDIVEKYAEKNLQVGTPEAKSIVVNKIVEDITNNIKSIYCQELEKEVWQKVNEKHSKIQEKAKIAQIITFLSETVILSGIIGLIVNQVTDIIDVTTESHLIVLVILLILLLIWIIFMYFNKLYEIIIKFNKNGK